MIIPLKRKYLRAWKGRFRSTHENDPRNKRHKLNDKAKALLPPQPKKRMVVDGRTGKSRMVTDDE